jgi:hypothetical protein
MSRAHIGRIAVVLVALTIAGCGGESAQDEPDAAGTSLAAEAS